MRTIDLDHFKTIKKMKSEKNVNRKCKILEVTEPEETLRRMSHCSHAETEDRRGLDEETARKGDSGLEWFSEHNNNGGPS